MKFSLAPLAVLLVVLAAAARPASAVNCNSYKHSRTVKVSSTGQLHSALRNARSGDLVYMNPGKYSAVIRGGGYRELTISGKSNVVLCGPSTAVIQGENVGSHSLLVIVKSSGITVAGISIRTGMKGVVIDSSRKCTLAYLKISNIGQEAIHVQKRSDYNVIKYCSITNTGRSDKGVGEGIYMGSDDDNRKDDHCAHNQILYNVIGPGVTAEPIDIKQSTGPGLVKGNRLDGRDLCGCNSAVSLINVKGNGWWVSNNIGSNAKEDFFKTASTIPGQGRGNNFVDNKCTNKARGGFYCVKVPNLRGYDSSGNRVSCGQHTNTRCKGRK